MKLISIKPSNRKDKKWTATFVNPVMITHFGARGYDDFTIHKDPIRKQLYLARHRNENWNNPVSAGSLSRYILWNKPTMSASINDFKTKFNL
jgi:hypothetical protein